MARIYKIMPEYISRKKRNGWLRVLFVSMAGCAIAGFQAWEDPEGWKISVGIGIIIPFIAFFVVRNQVKPLVRAMLIHGLTLEKDHLVFHEEGRETKIAYTQFTRAIFHTQNDQIKSIRLIAAKWMDEELPQYEDFQTVAATLLDKLPTSVIERK